MTAPDAANDTDDLAPTAPSNAAASLPLPVNANAKAPVSDPCGLAATLFSKQNRNVSIPRARARAQTRRPLDVALREADDRLVAGATSSVLSTRDRNSDDDDGGAPATEREREVAEAKAILATSLAQYERIRSFQRDFHSKLSALAQARLAGAQTRAQLVSIARNVRTLETLD